jgi:hypothetical protein
VRADLVAENAKVLSAFTGATRRQAVELVGTLARRLGNGISEAAD